MAKHLLTPQDATHLLKARRPDPPLIALKPWQKELSQSIKTLNLKPLVKAALYLWNDDLEPAHLIAQEHENQTGCLIHAVMHRRQPEYWNAKYWYRRVGQHPIFQTLKSRFTDWDPFLFVDWCEASATNKPSKETTWLQTLQAYELQLIAQYCLEQNK